MRVRPWRIDIVAAFSMLRIDIVAIFSEINFSDINMMHRCMMIWHMMWMQITTFQCEDLK